MFRKHAFALTAKHVHIVKNVYLYTVYIFHFLRPFFEGLNEFLSVITKSKMLISLVKQAVQRHV